MNKRLKAELWEIQVILYLILATQLTTEWLKWLIYIWCVITFVGSLWLAHESKKEEKLK